MIRQISQGSTLMPESQPKLVTVPAAAPASSGAVAPPVADARDALAGALPVWDLLPASPFIRRIK